MLDGDSLILIRNDTNFWSGYWVGGWVEGGVRALGVGGGAVIQVLWFVPLLLR